MKVRMKRVYEAADEADGKRILVDRLWPRGLTREAAHVDLWLKAVAPSDELRKWFGHDPAKWDGFRKRYHAELAHNADAVAELRAAAREGHATLVYSAKDEAHNNAVVLLELLAGAK